MTTTTIDSEVQAPPSSRSGGGQSAAAARRQRHWMRPIVLLLVIAALGGGGWWGLSTLLAVDSQSQRSAFHTVAERSFRVVLREKGELKAAKSTEVSCEVEGRSTIISIVPEGSDVQKGDLLVELASDEIEDRIRQEEIKEANAISNYEAAQNELEIQIKKNESDIRKGLLAIELAELDLEKYQKGDWEQAVKDADIAIERAQIQLERAEEDFKASSALRAKEYITQAEYNEDEFKKKQAEWDLAKAKQSKEILINYTRKADVAQKTSDVDEAQKELERIRKNADAEEKKRTSALEAKKRELDLIRLELSELRSQREKSRIYAPANGVVVYGDGSTGGWRRGDDEQIKEGTTVRERQVLITLPDTERMVVVARIHEAKTSKIRLGQECQVTVEGVPGRTFPGRVSRIAPLADTQNRWLNPDVKEYETEIALEPTDAPLKPGATAYVEILVETVEDAVIVPVQSLFTKAGRRYVFVDGPEGVEPREIELGATGTEWAQVHDGLAAGDEILLAVSENLQRSIPDLPPPKREHRGPGGFGPGGRAPTTDATHGGGPERMRAGHGPKPTAVGASGVQARRMHAKEKPKGGDRPAGQRRRSADGKPQRRSSPGKKAG